MPFLQPVPLPPEEFVPETFLRCFRWGKAEGSAQGDFHGVFIDILPFDEDLFAHHDRRGGRQVEGVVLVGVKLGFRLRYGFHLYFMPVAQPGHHLEEVLSGLPPGLVEKESDFHHWLPSFQIAPFMTASIRCRNRTGGR